VSFYYIIVHIYLCVFVVLLRQHAECPCLKQIVVLDAINEGLQKLAKECNVELMTFADLLARGSALQTRPQLTVCGVRLSLNSHIISFTLQPPKPTSIATICYTSGTTGMPKGAVITHKNICAVVSALGMFKNAELTEKDVYMSFLPLAHMFERLIHVSTCFLCQFLSIFVCN
jgi:long-chain acyl-CoA synthetase